MVWANCAFDFNHLPASFFRFTYRRCCWFGRVMVTTGKPTYAYFCKIFTKSDRFSLSIDPLLFAWRNSLYWARLLRRWMALVLMGCNSAWLACNGLLARCSNFSKTVKRKIDGRQYCFMFALSTGGKIKHCVLVTRQGKKCGYL